MLSFHLFLIANLEKSFDDAKCWFSFFNLKQVKKFNFALNRATRRQLQHGYSNVTSYLLLDYNLFRINSEA